MFDYERYIVIFVLLLHRRRYEEHDLVYVVPASSGTTNDKEGTHGFYDPCWPRFHPPQPRF